jgi:hypothetical protein
MTKEDATILARQFAFNGAMYLLQSGAINLTWNLSIARLFNTRKMEYSEALALTAFLTVFKFLAEDLEFYIEPANPDDYDDVLKPR